MRLRLPSRRPFLSLADATFRLGEHLVFKHTTWKFQRQEHWAVVGPNGSGKSWFVDGLRGRLPLVEGELRFGFRPPAGLNPEDAIGHIGFEDRRSELHGTVVQSRWNSIEEEGALRVGEFLSYEKVMDINPYEVDPGRERAEEGFLKRRRRAARLLSMEPFFERTLFSLSNGERQRAQWARALCQPLRLLILDEPFSGLDAQTRGQFYRLLEGLMQTPLRVLYVTAQKGDLPDPVTHVLEVDGFQVVAARARNRGFESQAQVRSFPASGRAAIRSQEADAFSREGKGKQLVSLRNVTVRYGARTVLNGVTWVIRAGESWALLGANGAGKSTLLSLILGDNPQVYGNEVEVFGRSRGQGESMWEIKKHIGWISPELHLHFNEAITCLEVVASGFRDTIGLFEPATSRQVAAAKGWLRQFDLLDFARAPLSALSLGQQRMVLLARSVVKRPRLLILDEPCQGLDRAHRELFLKTIDKLLRRDAVTAVYVTHRPEEIPRSITRVLYLANGRAEEKDLDRKIGDRKIR